MHELSICQSIFRSLEEQFSETELDEMTEIHLQIGVLSGVEPLLLKSAYEILVSGSRYRDVQLEIETVPVRAECSACQHRFAVEAYRFICPRCDSNQITVISGNELKVHQVVLEEPEEEDYEKTNQ